MMNRAEFANIARAEERMWWFRGMRRILFRLLDPLAQNRLQRPVLEAGCGTGYMAKQLAARYGWSMVPMDLAAEGLRHGRELGLGNLVQGDLVSLPFADASFDAVLSLDVVVHFPRGEEGRPLAELARVAAPGALFVLRVSALDVLRSRHSMFVEERQRFTRGRLLQAVEDSGIRVHRCTYANSLLLPVALAKFRLWEPLTRQAPASGVEVPPKWLNRLLYAPLALESAWLQAGFSFALGQTLILVGQKPAGLEQTASGRTSRIGAGAAKALRLR